MKLTAKCAALFAGLLGFMASSLPAHADWELNMPEGVTAISKEVYDLHMLILWICVVIGVFVFGAIIWSVVFHRKSKGAKPADFHESTTVEIIWTVIPFVILIAMAVPAAKTLVKMEDTGDSELTIKITGYQWKWHYEYLDDGISFFSTLSTPRAQIGNVEEKGENYLLEVDHPLVLPVNKKIRFLLTANDVIHAWWVPDLAVKKDAIPGFINDMWTKIDKPGIYRGQCAELCGRDHGFMPIVIIAKEEQAYQAWLQQQKTGEIASAAVDTETMDMDELMQRGQLVYNSNCAVCHQPDGMGLPGAFPAISGSSIATGPVDSHLNMVLKGKAGTAMQAFAKQLNNAEIAAVMTYQRNAFGNSVGDSIQPEMVETARN